MSKKIAIKPKPAGSATPAEADAWVESREAAPDPVRAGKAPSGGTVRISIDVSKALHKRMKLACVEKGVKLAEEVRAILEKHYP